MTRGKEDNGVIRGIATGVPGFDAVLGGGLPEYSFNLIVGGPGAGKTTLAQQIIFANATPERPAIYFTVLGEPTLKMIRYQQGFGFFDRSRVGSAIQYVNLSEEALESDLSVVLDRMVQEVESVKPGIVVVDSFRTIAERVREPGVADRMTLDRFIQRLSLHLTSWEVTSFLIGEYAESEQRNPVFTVADGVFWLSQVADRNSVVRKLQVMKTRGRAPMPGLHTFRITDDGVQIFPRIPQQQMRRRSKDSQRLGTGVPGLDELMGGGIPGGDAVMIAGPAGSGKTTFATQFVAEGLRLGEAVVVAVFEEYPQEYLARAKARNQHLHEALKAGKLKLIYLRPLDLSVDEALAEILDAVEQVGATRVVIDSLSGFEVALAPAFREDFRESLYRLIGALTAVGVTIVMTSEVVGGYPEVRYTSEKVSFITDDIVVQRFVEIGGELLKVLSVAKMRGSEHSSDFRLYQVSANGAVVSGSLKDYHGISTGVPDLGTWPRRSVMAGLTSQEAAVLNVITRLGESSLEQIGERTGLTPTTLVPMIERLVVLGYAAAVMGGEGTAYRAPAQIGG